MTDQDREFAEEIDGINRKCQQLSRRLERLPIEAKCLLAESGDLYWLRTVHEELSHIVGKNSLDNFYHGSPAPDKMFRNRIWEGENTRVVYHSSVAMVECEEVPSFSIEILSGRDALGVKIWLPLEEEDVVDLWNPTTDELKKKIEDHPQASLSRTLRVNHTGGAMNFAQALAQEIGMAITGLRNPPFRLKTALLPASEDVEE